MKIVFAGTPDFAVQPLQSIIDAGYEVVGVVTQADKPQGRKGILTPPPVKVKAQEYGIPVLQPQKIKDELDSVLGLGADVMVTCAYGQILPQTLLDGFPKGVWNIHAGILPQYRGASPIQSSIINGETQTGVTVMQTVFSLDAGDILLEERTEIAPLETYGELSARLSNLGAELIVRALKSIRTGAYVLTPQSKENVGVVRKIAKEDAKIDFTKRAKEIVDLVRGMNPAPVAYTQADGLKINVYKAEKTELLDDERAVYENAAFGEVLGDKVKRGLIVKCLDGAVKLAEVQAAGGKRMTGGDFLNGRKVQKGQVLC